MWTILSDISKIGINPNLLESNSDFNTAAWLDITQFYINAKRLMGWMEWIKCFHRNHTTAIFLNTTKNSTHVTVSMPLRRHFNTVLMYFTSVSEHVWNVKYIDHVMVKLLFFYYLAECLIFLCLKDQSYNVFFSYCKAMCVAWTFRWCF